MSKPVTMRQFQSRWLTSDKPAEPPSQYYQFEGVQYFPAGPEIPLSNEAAAQKAYKAEEEARLR